MRKSILLIGGTRFFGRIVVKKMIDLGWSVTLLTRGNRSPEIDHPNLSVLMGDRRDETSMWKLLKDKNFDAVVDNISYEPQDADAVARGRVWTGTSRSLCSPRGRYSFGVPDPNLFPK